MGFLVEAFVALQWYHYVMWVIGGGLIFIAIRFKVEPALLLPIGFGCILVNIPLTSVLTQTAEDGSEIVGILSWLYEVGIDASEAMPILLFIGIGAMIDFEPLIANPKLMFLGGFAQIGIFLTIILAICFGFDLQDAASIGIIGAADGPTSILVANQLGSNYTAQIIIVAYSYMALVPIIQPMVIKLCTTKKERLIRMDKQKTVKVSRLAKILFPIVITFVAGMIAPASLALVGFLMFGNLLKECLVLDSMRDTAKDILANLVTLLLGITIAASMGGEQFLKLETLIIMGLGLLAFAFDTMGGVFFAKFLNLFLKNKINPMIGGAGISAFPMSARVVHKMGLKEDPTNHLLMHAVGANVSGQIASAIIGGLILSLVPAA